MIALTETLTHSLAALFDKVVWQMTAIDRNEAVARRVRLATAG